MGHVRRGNGALRRVDAWACPPFRNVFSAGELVRAVFAPILDTTWCLRARECMHAYRRCFLCLQRVCRVLATLTLRLINL